MDDLQATSKWATRILRPLTSIYRRLEKHQETLAIIAAESKREEDLDNSRELHVPKEPETAFLKGIYSGSDADEDDPVWIPGKKPDQRRVKHRFSNRGGQTGKRRTRISVHSPEANRILPGAIELATPLITGKRWEAPPSAQSQGSAEQPRGRRSQGQMQAFRDRYRLQKSPWQELLDQSGDTGFADIAHNLDRVLQNFLCNTRLRKPTNTEVEKKPKRGARSLMSMVVRRLPEFIETEQEMQNEMQEDKDDDMCGAYFTELESFYAPNGKGWRPLREAVRAQGLYLVSALIRNKWVTDLMASALIENCRQSEPDACEVLLSTFLSSCTVYPYPLALSPPVDSSVSWDPVRLLRKYASHGVAHRTFIFDELAKLLQHGVLPPQWMSTKLWTSWMTRAIISFSKEDSDCAAAAQLIEAVLIASGDIQTETSSKHNTNPHRNQRGSSQWRATRTSSIGQMSKPELLSPCPVPVEDALSNHVTSLLSALCGIHISRSRASEEWKDLDETKAGNIINYVSYILERKMEQSCTTPKVDALTAHQFFRRGCIIIADCLLRCNDAIVKDDHELMMPAAPSLEGICEYLSARPDLIKEMALFVRQSFRCFGGSGEDEDLAMGREIRRMVSRLPRLGKLPCLSSFLRQVAMETAMHFAEGTGEPDDHLWAIEIQETIIALHAAEETGSDSTNRLEESLRGRGYRWEESIGEWIARTPASKPDPAPRVIRGRHSMTAKPLPYIPCSSDSSSAESERSVRASSSLTSSPTSMEPTSCGTKRNIPTTDSSPTRPIKRRRPDPVIVENSAISRAAAHSTHIVTRSSLVQREPSRHRALRDKSNYRVGTRSAATRLKPESKVEVVIVNQKGNSPRREPLRPAPGSVEMQVHRTMERRRPGRPKQLSNIPQPTIEIPRLRTVIPCSDDSDDELSFL